MKKETKSTEKSNKFDYRTIKTFKDAYEKVNLSPASLPNFNTVQDEFRGAIVAVYKLFIIFKAINNGWSPDWSNTSQMKYYPWFSVLSSGFGFVYSIYIYVYSSTHVGSRLCTDTKEKAEYIAKTFEHEYKEFMLFPE